MEPNSQIVILTAVMIEANAIIQRLKLKKYKAFYWSGNEIDLYNIGIRAGRLNEVHSQLQVESQLRDAPLIIMAGLAGALDPTLKVGDIVMDGQPHVAARFDEKIGPIGNGSIATVGTIVATPEEKLALKRQTNCLAVDMETAMAAKAAKELGCPFLAIRAISDQANETLDPKIVELVDSDGRPRAGKIAAALIKRPALVKELSHLKKSSDMACGILADKVAEVVSRWRETLATK